jgi:hypothetical protein
MPAGNTIDVSKLENLPATLGPTAAAVTDGSTVDEKTVDKLLATQPTAAAVTNGNTFDMSKIDKLPRVT